MDWDFTTPRHFQNGAPAGAPAGGWEGNVSHAFQREGEMGGGIRVPKPISGDEKPLTTPPCVIWRAQKKEDYMLPPPCIYY